MGLNRYFNITAETRNRKPILNPELADRACAAIDRRYSGWCGSLYDYEDMHIDGVNWYDCDEDMTAVSKEFPELIFCVYCDGMGLDDTWTVYYCDGRQSGGNAEMPEPDYDYLLTGKRSGNKNIMLTQYEIALISEALVNLYESRSEEIRWAGQDTDLIECDTRCMEDVDRLLDKLNENEDVQEDD